MIQRSAELRFTINDYKKVWRRRSRKLRNIAVGVTLVTGMVLFLCLGDFAGEEKEYRQIHAETVAEAVAKKETEVHPYLAGDADGSYQFSEEELAFLLRGEPYADQLRSLYEKYPQAGRILADRKEYPDWLIEYFIGHEEAVEWVVDYPDYVKMDQEELVNRALLPVNPEDYEKQKGIPLYFQWDQTWGYTAYGSETVATGGCGPTCLAMVATYLTGDGSMTPKKIADFSVAEGYYTEDAGTSWSLMEEGARKLGLPAWQIQNWSQSSINSELAAGHPLICSMGPGDFTETGHFIVLAGLTEDGKVIVNDPNSKINSIKRWDTQVLLEQMKAMWAYTT